MYDNPEDARFDRDTLTLTLVCYNPQGDIENLTMWAAKSSAFQGHRLKHNQNRFHLDINRNKIMVGI